MIQLMGVLFAVALLIVAFQALWPLLVVGIVFWLLYLWATAHDDERAEQEAKRRAYEQGLIKRATKQHAAILKGNTAYGTYGAYPPKVPVKFIKNS